MRNVETFISQGGQFVVHGPAVRGFVPRAMGPNASAFITAEPQLVALMADRVSRALTAELKLSGTYADKVHVIVFNVFQPGQVLGLVTQVHTDGFLYKLSVPAQVEGQVLLKGLMQVLLMEHAHRGKKRTGEMPNWMVEGMVRQLQTRVVPTYVVNRKPMTIETAGYDRLGATRDYLQTNAPMTLQELSFADLTRVTPEQREQFEASSHLLVHQLLKLKAGPLIFMLIGVSIERIGVEALEQLEPKLVNPARSQIASTLKELNEVRVPFEEVEWRERYLRRRASPTPIHSLIFTRHVRAAIEKGKQKHTQAYQSLGALASKLAQPVPAVPNGAPGE